MHQHVKQHSKAPFRYGELDCCLWAVSHIQAITGIDVGGDFRGKYSTKKSAFALIKKVTGGATVESVVDFVTAKFGMPELVTVTFAEWGVTASLLVQDGQPCVGIVHLDGKNALFVAENGLNKIEVSKCSRAWRVGVTHPANGEVKGSKQ